MKPISDKSQSPHFIYFRTWSPSVVYKIILHSDFSFLLQLGNCSHPSQVSQNLYMYLFHSLAQCLLCLRCGAKVNRHSSCPQGIWTRWPKEKKLFIFFFPFFFPSNILARRLILKQFDPKVTHWGSFAKWASMPCFSQLPVIHLSFPR